MTQQESNNNQLFQTGDAVQSYKEHTTDTNDTQSIISNDIQNNKEPLKKNKRNLYIIVAIIVVFLLGGTWYAISLQKEANQEEMAYAVLENNNNTEDYIDFLEKYPNSPYTEEIRLRLAKLEEMIGKWRAIAMSDNVNDFKSFKQTYTDIQYGRLCDIKIDSLDYITAQKIGTSDAYQQYLANHPDGRYASEASIAQGYIRNQEVSDNEQSQIINVLTVFYDGFASKDDDKICTNIAATMTTFLHQHNTNKATVLNTIHSMFSEDIKGCQFNVNRDLQVKRKTDNNTDGNYYYIVTFTVDQHIQRDNEGKTYGQYNCTAEINAQMLITSLTMQEISKN